MQTKAAILYEMGLPAPFGISEPLKIETVNLEGIGANEVLVEIAAAGICHSDLSVVDGSRPRVMPMVLGHEASGVVRETGANVTEFAVDDHVVFSFVPVCGHCKFCVAGRAALCERGAKANVAGTLLSGAQRFANAKEQVCHHHLGVSAFSQYTIAAQESLVKIDKNLSLETAALFGCAVMTGVGAVFNTAQVAAGTSVAVFGMGGVGLSAIMGAKAAGAFPIIAVDVLDEKLRLASEIGAAHTVNATNNDVTGVIKDLTNGGAQNVFESVGSAQVLQTAYNSTARGGTTITLGLPAPDKMLQIPAVSLVAEERTIKGSYMGSAIPRRDIPHYIALYQAGLLPVDKLHTHTLKLEDINYAFDRLAEAKAVRQIIKF